MNKSFILAAVLVLAVTGLAATKMMGIGGGCCLLHHVENSK